MIARIAGDIVAEKVAALDGVPLQKMDLITAQVAGRAGLSIKALRSPRRTREIAHARQRAYLILHDAGYSFPQIGRYFNRDHTTVMFGVKRERERRRAEEAARVEGMADGVAAE